jgi:hypothetical protein
MEKMNREKLENILSDMNTEEHSLQVSRDYNGNTGDYRVATHDGANYLYISDWYGIAMQTYAIEGLTGDQINDLIEHGQADRL